MKLNKCQCLLFLSALILSPGCSTSKKAEISSSANPSDELSRTYDDLSQAKNEQIDVLAKDSFDKSFKHYERAKEKMAENSKQEDILDELRYSKGYLNDARAIANDKRKTVEPILIVRQKALDAGANQYPQFSSKWKKAEYETSQLTKKSNEAMDSDDIKKVQDQYTELELLGITERNLGDMRVQIAAAEENKGRSLAPMSLRNAQNEYASASNIIAANRSNSRFYQKQVDSANLAGERLTKVLALTSQRGHKISETAAIALVMKEEENEKLGKEVTQKGKELSKAQDQVVMKQALANAAAKFDESEATVYEQGENLVIRLKTINFKSGRADLPSSSYELLSKVGEVAKDLAADEIMVQGHTDSIGSNKINQKLSEARADSVANYFKQNGIPGTILSEGRGDMEPLTSNRTAVGRAENRRVDIVIRPTQL